LFTRPPRCSILLPLSPCPAKLGIQRTVPCSHVPMLKHVTEKMSRASRLLRMHTLASAGCTFANCASSPPHSSILLPLSPCPADVLGIQTTVLIRNALVFKLVTEMMSRASGLLRLYKRVSPAVSPGCRRSVLLFSTGSHL